MFACLLKTPLTLGHEDQNSERNARNQVKKILETLMKTPMTAFQGVQCKEGVYLLSKAYSFSIYELRDSKSKKGTLVIDYTFSIFSTATSSLTYESNKNGLR